MEIYYLKKSEFLKNIKQESLEEFSDGRQYLSKDKYIEHLCGLFLTKFCAKHIYEIENPQINVENKKPCFANEKLQFSISHSSDIVLVVFNNKNIGADIEYMSERNYDRIMKRYGETTQNPTKNEFYRFWTVHEAEIKLQREIKSIFSTLLEKDYMLSCVSDDVLITNFCIKKLTCTNRDTDLVKEYQYPQNLIFEK